MNNVKWILRALSHVYYIQDILTESYLVPLTNDVKWLRQFFIFAVCRRSHGTNFLNHYNFLKI